MGIGAQGGRQSVLVDNRGGGDGYVGSDGVVRAEPDGYTLLYAPGSRIMIAPHLVRRADVDPVKSLLPVAPTGRISLFLMTHPGVPGSDLASFLQHARANPARSTTARRATARRPTSRARSSPAKRASG